MNFSISQFEKFKTKTGAYSVVTAREEKDSQVTLTDYEAELVISFFGRENIQTGNVESNRRLSSKPFLLYPSGKEIKLNLIYPKPGKGELRLYLAKRAGFKPAAGDIWFMFIKDKKLWIGAQKPGVWRSEALELWEDQCEEFYLSAIAENDRARIRRLQERDVYSRNRKLAVKRMEEEGYSCQYDPGHKLFVAKSSKKPYLEAHHLIPMKAQPYFNRSLDSKQNICCLCPYCHSAVHYAEDVFARGILMKLISLSPVLKAFSLRSYNDILGLYGLEKIGVE